MAILLSASRIRSWLAKIVAGTDLAPTAATNATPAVVAAVTTTLNTGDVIAQWGFSTNTNLNGVFLVGTIVDGGHYQVTDFSGTVINGNGATSAGHAVRLAVSLKPHDIKNMCRTLKSVSYVRDSDAADPTYGQESTVQTLFGQ